ncbi:MAG TPA: hypothetical protein VGJ66_25410, partial [Pyrinomonadaceae bacterium]
PFLSKFGARTDLSGATHRLPPSGADLIARMLLMCASFKLHQYPAKLILASHIFVVYSHPLSRLRLLKVLQAKE